MTGCAADLPDDTLTPATHDDCVAVLGEPGPVVAIAVDALVLADSPRRGGEDPRHVRALADTFAGLPPIVVHRPTMRVVDGAHRVRAARLRGLREIRARFLDGGVADAFVFAVRANVAHGLPLSLPDRRRAAERIVTSHPDWSDRLVASVVGLSPKTVADVRRATAPQPRCAGRIGQDGRVRPVDGAERRRIARDLLRDDPTLSLRQVARTAGISPETARSVRTRLLRGEDPVRPRGRSAVPAEAPAAAPPPDWTALVRQLRGDPALRFTDSGRALLRLLDAHALGTPQWAGIGANVPPHCRQAIARLALECARGWRAFADQLERTTTGPA